jgi:TolB protein
MKMKRTILLSLIAAAVRFLAAQESDILIKIAGGGKAVVAVPDFRGTGDAQKLMPDFNQTLWTDLESSGMFKMAPKSSYPIEIPQRPQDFKAPLPPEAATRRNAPPPRPVRQGPWLTDWSDPPVNANYLAFGYTAIQGDQFVLFGYFFNVNQPDTSNAQVIGKLYFGPLDASGARKVAHEFAGEILDKLGAKGLYGSRIFFVSDRTGNKEIWVMDYDGSNQRPFTNYKSLCTMPTLSPDGMRIAFTSFLQGNPGIIIHSTETGRRLPFYNQIASMNATADFTPDGKSIVYSSTASGWAQLYLADLDGSNLRRLTNTRTIEVEPKVNPRSGAEIVFVSGRSGPQQLYRMSIFGTDAERLTPGEGQASNPAWHPDGRHVAFAWTRGYEPGNFNIFVMDVATRQFVQLTHGAGRNENPSWAPDGRHIVFSSNRGRKTQIWSMLADGTQLKQLTAQGTNIMPVWSK